jgi:hypothetical protein
MKLKNCLLRAVFLGMLHVACLQYLFAQVPVALNDTDYTAYDYIHLIENVSLNDDLPQGPRSFRFLGEGYLGSIEWVDDTQGIFDYLADPLSTQTYAGWGQWVYQGPAADRYDNIYYEVCAGNYCDTALIKIWMGFQPDLPTANDDVFYLETGSTRTFFVGSNDYDPDSISDPNRGSYQFFSSSLPLFANNGTSPGNDFLLINGHFTYTAAPGFVGSDSFTYTMWEPIGCDGISNLATVTVHVLPQNGSPSAQAISLDPINEESTLTVNLLPYASDPENETLSFRLVGQSNEVNASVSSTGTLTYSPFTNFIGYDTLYYEVMDLVGQTDTAMILVSVVNGNNDAPDAPSQSFTVSEDTSLNQSIAFNDLVDGDMLTYALENPPIHGTASISSTGELTYQPLPNFFGTDIITYRSCDDGNLCDFATIEIIVIAANDAPLAQDDANSIPRNTTLYGSVNQNDSDIDSPNHTLTYSLQNAPAHGEVVLLENGSYTYTPETVFYGEDSFSYTVCDNLGACSSADVTILVTFANLAPQTSNYTVTLNEDESILINLQLVSSDVDGGDLSYSLLNISDEGSFQSVVNTGVFFTPSLNRNGIITLDFQVCDTGNLCDTATITMLVNAVNDAPEASEAFFTTFEDVITNWEAVFNDIDNDGLTLNVVTPPTHSIVNGNQWIPANDFFGLDSLIYQVCDNEGLCDQATVYLNVIAVNDAPSAFPFTLNGVEDQLLEVNLSAIDIDSPFLSYSLLESANSTIVFMTADGTINWMPPVNYFGTLEAPYHVCDDQGMCDTATVTMHIAPVNDAPQSAFPLIEMEEDQSITIALSSYIFDIESQSVFTSLAGSSGVQAQIDPTLQTIQLTATDNYFGNASCYISICDIAGACISDTLQIIINPINDAPEAEDFELITFIGIQTTDSWYNHASDIDNGLLSFETLGGVGTIITSSDGSFVYTPANEFIGIDSVSVSICDDAGACDTSLLTILVFPPNEPPMALNATFETCQNIEISADLNQLASDDAYPASAMNYMWNADAPATITIDNETAHVIIQPTAQFSGLMNIQMIVCDNASPSLCDTSNLSITVIPNVYAYITAAQVDQISCFGSNDGSISIEQVDASVGAEFAWSNGTVGPNQSNLSPGEYSVVVTADAICAIPTISAFTIAQPDSIELAITSYPIVDALGGTIECQVSGGTPPYSYSWTGPQEFTSTNATASGLMHAGQYFVTITDANGCSINEQAIITSSDEISNSFNSIIYPNPTNGEYLHISNTSLTSVNRPIQLLDATGRLLESITQLDSMNRIPVGHLEAGMYFIRFVQGEKENIQQFIRTP